MLRGFLGFGGNGGYFWTVTLLPLNDAIVLTCGRSPACTINVSGS